MRAVTVGTGHELGWEEVLDPVRGDGEVLVDIHATAVNRADLLQRRGKYPPPPGAPPYMGLEMSGRVAEVGPGSRWQVGDPVCALLAGGGYAERVSVHEDLLLPVPGGLSLAEAASLPEVFATAYLNLFLEAELAEGETLFVHAGASGVGIAATQLGRFAGAHVITTVGSRAKADAIRDLGADWILDRTKDDVGAAFDRAVEECGGVDVVLDCVGGADLGDQFGRLARGGRWVVIATLGGPKCEVDLRSLLVRGLRLIGSTLRGRPLDIKARIIRGLRERVWPEIEAGRIRPVVYRELPMARVAEAHEILERRENVGKVVLTVR